MRIGINCGHTLDGQPGSGAVGLIRESAETRAVGNALIMSLTKAGHKVYNCTDDYAISTQDNLNKIVEIANKQTLDLFVSIHFNSGGGKGVEVLTNNGTKHTEAVNVCNELNVLGFVNRGIKDGSKLAVVRRTNAKAMLIEVCFVDTKTDVDLYKHIGADAIAEAIAKAITDEEELTMTQYEELKARLDQFEKGARANETDNSMIYNYIDENMPEWAREPVQWCVNKGILVGANDKGELNLTYNKLWICTVLYRMAKTIS